MRILESHFANLIEDWRNYHEQNLADHLKWYASAKSLEEAIDRAAHAERGADRKRSSHQYRLPKSAPIEVRDALMLVRWELEECKSFDDLHSLVHRKIVDIHGVAHLMVYDTALRLGARLGIEPERVYVQRGALDGAKEYFRVVKNAVRIESGQSLPEQYFPLLSPRLNAAQIENFLCTMKDRIDPKKPYRPTRVSNC